MEIRFNAHNYSAKIMTTTHQPFLKPMEWLRSLTRGISAVITVRCTDIIISIFGFRIVEISKNIFDELTKQCQTSIII